MHMKERTGGRVLADALAGLGVDTVFMLHGGHLDPFWDATLDAGVRLVDMRHEQAAVHAAEGWAWATGRPGVAAVTAGPGVTGAMTGLVNAWSSAAPVLLLGGRPHTASVDTRGLQDIDLLPSITPFAKFARTVYDPRRIEEYVRRAWSTALSGRPGPVFLEVPFDVLRASTDHEPLPMGPLEPPRVVPDPDALDRAADILRAARRPVVLAGGGIHWSHAAEDLVRFVNATGIPVTTHGGGRGAISDGHELCLGSAPPAAGGAAVAALAAADAVLVVGARLNFTLAHGAPPVFAAEAQMIRVDIEPSELREGRTADVELVGDAGLTLHALAGRLSGGRTDRDAGWLDLLRAGRREADERRRRTAASAAGIHPLAIPLAISDVLGHEGTVVLDGGDIHLWSLGATMAHRPGRWLTEGPLGTLGMGLPFALAAMLARPTEPVALITGDGAFGLSAMEFDTAVRHNLPVVCVIANDRSWGRSRHGQGFAYGYDRVVGVELGDNARYDRFAEAMGGVGFLVERPEQLRRAIELALAAGRPAIVDVRTDRQVVSPFMQGMVHGGASGGRGEAGAS